MIRRLPSGCEIFAIFTLVMIGVMVFIVTIERDLRGDPPVDPPFRMDINGSEQIGSLVIIGETGHQSVRFRDCSGKLYPILPDSQLKRSEKECLDKSDSSP